MASTIRQRLRRYNGTDYDTVHLETHANNVLVNVSFDNPLNTDQLILGQHDVYFKAYPNLKWCVDHLDGDYVYLGLYNASEKTAFGSNTAYIGSTIAAKCNTFLNSTIPNVSECLEPVTVNGVTNKVFIPSHKMMSGTANPYDGSDANDPTFDWPSASKDNRVACVSDWLTISNHFWLSSPYVSGYLSRVDNAGNFGALGPNTSFGFRPEVKVRYRNSTQDTLDHVLEGIVPSSIPLDVYSDNTQKCNTLIFQTTLSASSGTAVNYPTLTAKLKATYGNVNAYFDTLTAYKYLQFKWDIVSAGIEVQGGGTTYVGMMNYGYQQVPIPLGYYLQQLNNSSSIQNHYIRNITLWSHVFIKYVYIDGNVSGLKATPAWLRRVRYMDSLDIGRGNTSPPGFTYDIDTYDTSSSSYGDFDTYGRLCWPFNRTSGTTTIYPFASTAGATDMTFSIYGSN